MADFAHLLDNVGLVVLTIIGVAGVVIAIVSRFIGPILTLVCVAFALGCGARAVFGSDGWWYVPTGLFAVCALLRIRRS